MSVSEWGTWSWSLGAAVPGLLTINRSNSNNLLHTSFSPASPHDQPLHDFELVSEDLVKQTLNSTAKTCNLDAFPIQLLLESLDCLLQLLLESLDCLLSYITSVSNYPLTSGIFPSSF